MSASSRVAFWIGRVLHGSSRSTEQPLFDFIAFKAIMQLYKPLSRRVQNRVANSQAHWRGR